MILSKHIENPWKNLKKDLPAGMVVFLVAMPFCLGVAMASGAPLFAGLISGVIGGVVVGALSGSPLGVSGPAAGLAVIVLNSIQSLGNYEAFLLVVVLSGVFQIVLGFLRAGVVAYFFPSSVINGMLAGIGVIIILKQIPYAFGYNSNPGGNFSFFKMNLQEMWSQFFSVLESVSFGPTVITLVSLGILILWETRWIKRVKVFQLVQGPLVAVMVSVVMSLLFSYFQIWVLKPYQLVNIPVSANIGEFFSQFRLPDFSYLWNFEVYSTALVLTAVSSIESLLCVEASDKQDPLRRVTPTNLELQAQGIGNILSGMIGGIPVAQVIVRSSVNVQAGGRTKASAIFHGFLILFSVVLIPSFLNLIPLSALAAILLVVGYKLAHPNLFKKKWSQGKEQLIPFLVTIVGIVFTDLLLGIAIGFVFAIFFILHGNSKIPISVQKIVEEDHDIEIELTEDVSFLKKVSLLKILNDIPDGKHVILNATKTQYMHQDVLDIIEDFKISAEERKIRFDLIGFSDEQVKEPMLHFKVK